MQQIFRVIAFSLTVFAALALAQNSPPARKTNARPVEKASVKEPYDGATIEAMKSRCVRFETEKGQIEIELYPESAPESVRNFLNLIAIGAMETTTFSRVVPNFVIQGGDIETRTQIKPALALRGRRIIPDEPNKIRHERGVVSMARSDEPNTTSSHFFILVRDAPFLDGKYAAFGRVTTGLETVDAINRGPVQNEVPNAPVRITRAVVFGCSK